MSSYTLSHRAATLPILHAARHPTQTVCGLLVGTSSSSRDHAVSDAIPLLHHWTELSAMMELALQIAEHHVKAKGKEIIGLYIANERLGDLDVPVGLGKAADAIQRQNEHALIVMIDNVRLNSTTSPFLPYLSSSSTWSHSTSTALSISDPSTLATAQSLIEAGRHELVGDFDDHLEDAPVDWLENAQLDL
ncbi:hypothetical protein JCM10212_003371 [Sporobolomyces blumeae]